LGLNLHGKKQRDIGDSCVTFFLTSQPVSRLTLSLPNIKHHSFSFPRADYLPTAMAHTKQKNGLTLKVRDCAVDGIVFSTGALIAFGCVLGVTMLMREEPIGEIVEDDARQFAKSVDKGTFQRGMKSAGNQVGQVVKNSVW
jgi:hypothetical protein